MGFDFVVKLLFCEFLSFFDFYGLFKKRYGYFMEKGSFFC